MGSELALGSSMPSSISTVTMTESGDTIIPVERTCRMFLEMSCAYYLPTYLFTLHDTHLFIFTVLFPPMLTEDTR